MFVHHDTLYTKQLKYERTFLENFYFYPISIYTYFIGMIDCKVYKENNYLSVSCDPCEVFIV